MTKHLSAQDIEFVSELAITAGMRAAQMWEGVVVEEKSDQYDKVTAADYEVSRIIVEALAARFPNDVIVSEEDKKHRQCSPDDRVWLIDPIDGTENYISNDGQYAVMIGLLVHSQPVFGWVYAPAILSLYFGGPDFGTFKTVGTQEAVSVSSPNPLDIEANARVIMGLRDRKSHPWVKEHPKVVLVKTGSIGLKVAKVLEREADIFVHLSGKLKTWDTAGPAAIALGANLDVGSLDHDGLPFDITNVRQECSVIMGRPGALKWSRRYLQPDKVHCENGINN